MLATSDREGQRLVSTQTVQHDYLTLNGKVARETITTDGTVTAILDFIYDESGRPFALNYSTNGGSSFKTYYYILNLQGDVVKLVWYIPGFEYEAVATYTYDAWGNILTATGDMADINPLRYRGYYYDSETGFYYLQSRYYDPVNRRFINADAYITTDVTDTISCNMFAYCSNNPVMFLDENGYMPQGNQKFQASTLNDHFSGGGGAIAAAAVLSAGALQVLWEAVEDTAKDAFNAAKELQRDIAAALQEAKKKIPHVHHIVPTGNFTGRSEYIQGLVAEMHEILKGAGINRYFDGDNLMLVSAGTHASLHTDEYIIHVHSYISAAAGDEDAIREALFHLRIEIAAKDIYASGY